MISGDPLPRMSVEPTCVLHGIFDSICPSPQLSPYQNKIGGYPDSYRECLLSSAPICGDCHSPLLLLVQLYCPLEASPYHRLLHIFCCTQSSCWISSKSWLVLRSQSLDTSERNDVPHNTRSEAIECSEWCAGADDWGSEGEEDCDSSVVVSTSKISILPRFEKLAIGSERSRETGRGIDQPSFLHYRGPHYDSAYISVVEDSSWYLEEAIRLDPQRTQADELLKRYRSENPLSQVTHSEAHSAKSKKKSPSGGELSNTGCKEGYEKASAKHGDDTFLKFQKEMSKCPQQILRYCWKGKPLWLRDEEQEVTRVCASCGAPSVFECQLMPSLVYTIQTKCTRTKDNKLPVVEFGTAVIYSCSLSCWDQTDESASFKKEHIILQIEI